MQERLQKNIESIIDAIRQMPDVIDVAIQEPDNEQHYEKKVFVNLARCDELVVLEIF